jgi:hypothetical protein
LMKKKVLTFCFILFLISTPLKIAFSAEIGIKIEYPKDGDTILLSSDNLVIKGRAFARGDNVPLVDIIMAIDTSGSTARPSGVDVNGNGIIGRRVNEVVLFGVLVGSKITDPGDSVLAAEIQAARNLLYQLDPKTTRVGVVSFSGDFLPGTGYDGNRTFMANPATPDAYLVQPLSSNFELVARALDSVYRGGAFGGTNISEGIRVAIAEISGTKSSVSQFRPGAKKYILLLSDGVPTFPVGSASVSEPEDRSLAIRAAELANYAGITINTYALGRDSFDESETLRRIADATRGRYNPLLNPGDIVSVLPRTSFIGMDFVDVINVTHSKQAEQVVLNPAGGFLASIPVKNGINKITAVAHATDGKKAEDGITITFRKVDKDEDLKNLVLTKKNDLSLDLERQNTEKIQLDVEKAHQKALQVELERARKRNQELDAQIAEQKKQLQKKTKKDEEKESKKKRKEEKLELELDIKDTE